MSEYEPYQTPTELQPGRKRRRLALLVTGLFGGSLLLVALAILAIHGATSGKQNATEPPAVAVFGTALPTETPPATATPAPTPTATPTPLASTPVAVGPADGWTFQGVRVQPDLGLGGLLIYGEAVNNSGRPQRILGLQGTFYDAQGGAIIPQESSDYWASETVPPGSRVPFELTLIGPAALERVELYVPSEDSSEPARTDFQVSEVRGADAESEFCVTGRARNLGEKLNSYLMVVGVLYDADGQVINWGIGYQPAPAEFSGENTVIVSACADRYNQTVARYELRAWGN